MPQIGRYFLKLKADTKRLLRFRAEPSQVALGVAVGVFIGVFPTLGTGVLLTAALGALIRFNVPAALLAGTLSVAPPLGTFWIVLSAYVGGIRPEVLQRIHGSIKGLFQLGVEVLLHFLWGCLVVSIAASLMSYVVVLFIAKWQRRRKIMQQEAE